MCPEGNRDRTYTATKNESLEQLLKVHLPAVAIMQNAEELTVTDLYVLEICVVNGQDRFSSQFFNKNIPAMFL